MPGYWRVANPNDLEKIVDIANVCHPNFFEAKEVLAEKLTLAPNFCFMLVDDNGQSGGYFIAHPYRGGKIAPLNQRMLGLPTHCDCLYIHDLAILPQWRKHGFSRQIVDKIRDIAVENGYATIALVAVNNSAPFWQRHGFIGQKSEVLTKYLKTYGRDALYMTCCANDKAVPPRTEP